LEPFSVLDESEYGRLFKEASSKIRFVPIEPKEDYLVSESRVWLEGCLNREGYCAMGIVRPVYSGLDNNLLVLDQLERR
jgi:hypothetical protein